MGNDFRCWVSSVLASPVEAVGVLDVLIVIPERSLCDQRWIDNF